MHFLIGWIDEDKKKREKIILSVLPILHLCALKWQYIESIGQPSHKIRGKMAWTKQINFWLIGVDSKSNSTPSCFIAFPTI